jgi:CRP-like cAMP-binding protein
MSTTGHTSDELYELLAHRRDRRSCSPGEVIFSRGDSGDSLYVVLEGSVALKDGDRVVETVTAPGMFGEMAIIETGARALTAEAAGPAVLAEIPTRHFWVLVHETPYFAQLVMTVMARRLRSASGLNSVS